MGALVADAFALRTHQVYGADEIQAACGGMVPGDLSSPPSTYTKLVGDQTECGDELVHALGVVSRRGFEFEHFAGEWQDWARSYEGLQGPATREVLQNLAHGAPTHAAGSHYIDLGGAVRAPALLLLADLVEEDEDLLAAAAREAVLVTHENPKVVQAAEFLTRAALRLLQGREQPPPASGAERRRLTLAALRAAADAAGSQFHALIDDALSEAQRRDAFTAAGVVADDAFAAAREDREVIGRMTASGNQPGAEVLSSKTSYIVPAIVWLAVAYDSFAEAVVANAVLGGESGLRAIFVGLFFAARDGPSAIPAAWAGQLTAEPQLQRRPPPFMEPLRLCAATSACRGAGAGGAVWAGDLRMHHVAISAAVTPLEPRGRRRIYRVYVRMNASELLRTIGGSAKPDDWNDEEDGEWTPSEGNVACLARYFQFTAESGRHAPFGVWPLEALCRFTPAASVMHESFDVAIPEPLTQVIGGVVIGDADRVVKLPRLHVDPNAMAPGWSGLCDHVGTIKLPEGEWQLEKPIDLP